MPRMANNDNAYVRGQEGNSSEDRLINTPAHAMGWTTTAGIQHHHRRSGTYADAPGGGGGFPSSGDRAAMVGLMAAQVGQRSTASSLTGRGDGGHVSSSSTPSLASTASNKRPLLGPAAAGGRLGTQVCDEATDVCGKPRGDKKSKSGSNIGISSSAALQQQRQHSYGSPHPLARSGFAHPTPLPQSSRHSAEAAGATVGRGRVVDGGRGSTHQQPHLTTTGICCCYIACRVLSVCAWGLFGINIRFCRSATYLSSCQPFPYVVDVLALLFL